MGDFSIIAPIVFGTWLSVIVANQFKWPIRTLIRRYDHLHLFPVWWLFSPKPVCCDYRLVTRHLSGREVPGPWSSCVIDYRKGWAAAVWNPRFREYNVLVGAALHLAGAETSDARERLTASSGYLGLTTYCSSRCGATATRGFQFSIVSCREFDPAYPPHTVFESGYHVT